MKERFDSLSIEFSKHATRAYSTSFSLGILCLGKELRNPVYAVYGFVRLADEIVDSFHDYDKKALLNRFREDTYLAVDQRISLNPVLNSFQQVVHQYNIDRELIDCFLKSMEMDLSLKDHDNQSLEEYILGSAEVVGLMCLRIFTSGNNDHYNQLKEYAMSLGSAFQKVNFLRDLKDDYVGMGRSYFPDVQLDNFNDHNKRVIERSIEKDFHHALQGIKKLPGTSRFGVYVAYVYYLSLFKKIKNTPSERVMKSRIRIDNRRKATLLAYSYLRYQLNRI